MKVSLIVPLRDEASSVWRLLESILAQTRIPDEVVFVDAGSSDNTRATIEKHADGRLNLSVISTGPAYPGKARNMGVERSTHDLIAFTDGGIELDREWLGNLSETINKAGADVVYGHYKPRTDTFFRECLALVMMQPLVMVDGRWMRKRSIASSLLKKSVWRAVGGFPDARAGEDRVFMARIDAGSFKVSYSPSAVITWDIPGDLRGVWKRFSDYSLHNANAGRIWNWHMPVLTMYGAALIFIALGVFVSPVFYLPVAAAFIARIAKRVFVNRREPYLKARHLPAYLAACGFLTLFIDAATFAGWARSCVVSEVKKH